MPGSVTLGPTGNRTTTIFVGVLCVLVMLASVSNLHAREEKATCPRVVDRDTIQVWLCGRAEKVRLIGVDTPETVDPRKPVQYFGREASAFTMRLVPGQHVILRDDPMDQNRDRYHRLLRYVFLQDGTFVNAEIIRQGYGFAYTKYPFSLTEEFRALEREAREQGRGLWAEGPGD